MSETLNLIYVEARIMLALIYFYSFTMRQHKISGELLPSYPDLTKLIDSFSKSAPPPDILYLGDSVLLRTSRNDTENDTLDEVLAKILKDTFSITTIAHTAYHMQVYKNLISVLEMTKTRPKIVILPINLRSFSPQWDFYPSWQFHSEIRAIKKYLSNPTSKISSVDEISTTSMLLSLFDIIPVNFPLTNFKCIGQFRRIIKSQPEDEAQMLSRLKTIFIFHYMHPLVENHRKLVALEESIKLLRDMRIATILYVTPLNYQAGEKYVGKEFVDTIRSNVKIILDKVNLCQANGIVQFLDCSIRLDSSCFFNHDNATEHLNQSGRRILAKEITKMVLSAESSNKIEAK